MAFPAPAAPPPAADRFAACLAFTWQVDNDGQPYHVTPGDSGGPTAWGVTYAAFVAWRRAHGHQASLADLEHAEKTELAQLIRSNYWNAVQADHLPLGVDLMVYEFGFGSGPGTSARLLQEMVGLPEQSIDSSVGPITLAAAAEQNRRSLILRLGARHEAFYESLGSYSRFGHGWSRRNSQRLAIALATC